MGEGMLSQRRKNIVTLALIALSVLLLGASALAQNAIPLVTAPLVPGTKSPGSAAFTLTVNGTGFVSGATVYWNGSARTTTFVKSSQVTASINAADVATAGTANVTVANPAPGGGMSNVAHFEIVKTGLVLAYGKLEYGTDLTPQDAVSADFNGDGKADLAVATGNNSVSVLLGAGDGTFPTHVEYPVPGHPIAIIAADFNGDGKIDLATVDQFQSEITILLGNGDGTFQGHVEYPTGNQPVALATADVNGDGKLDIIVADFNDNKVAVLLGNGDGTFKAHVDYATGNGPSGVAIGDFNADGKLDLVVANNTDYTVAILLGNGDGTFGGPTPFNTAKLPNSVVIGDFNNDGKLDVAAGTSNKSVSVLLGNGNGTLQNHREFSIGANAVVVAAADVNSDGKVDLISANYNDNSVSVLLGNADGTFKAQSVYPTGAGPSGVAVGDFNNNGKLDIAVAAATANTVSVLKDDVITLSPSTVVFGTQTSGFKSAAKSITLKNNGTTTYTLGAISFTGASSTDFSQTNTCAATIAAGTTCVFSEFFTPTASETADAQMLITATNGTVYGAVMTGNGNIPITLTPRTMNFNTYQLIGTTSAPKTDTFTNDSGVPITFSLIDLEGANPNEFNMTNNCPISPATLAPGASCTSTVTFSPTQSGGANVTQVYYGNFTLAKQGLLISGLGTAVKVSPTTLNFGTIKSGSSSKAMTSTFTNAGSTAMTLSSENFTGTNPYWALDPATTTCPANGGAVAANSSCAFGFIFTPQAVGTFTATFSIGDTDPTGPQKITLNGTGN